MAVVANYVGNLFGKGRFWTTEEIIAQYVPGYQADAPGSRQTPTQFETVMKQYEQARKSQS